MLLHYIVEVHGGKNSKIYRLRNNGDTVMESSDMPGFVDKARRYGNSILRTVGTFNIYTGLPIEDSARRRRQHALSPEEHGKFWELWDRRRANV